MTDFSTMLNSTFSVNGWLRTIRKQKNMYFMAINDGSTCKNLQVICDLENCDDSLPEQLKQLQTGYCLKVTGLMVESPAKGQAIEMQLAKIEVNGLLMIVIHL